MVKIFLVLLAVMILTSCEWLKPADPSDEVYYLDGQIVMSLTGCMYLADRAGDSLALRKVQNFTCELEQKFPGGIITDNRSCSFFLSEKDKSSDLFYAKLIKNSGCRIVKEKPAGDMTI